MKNNKNWIVIFSHYPKNKVKFLNEEQAKSYDSSNLYSRLSSINEKHKINGFYEFMILYDIGKIRWRQKNNPCEENETIGKTSAEGFEILEYSTSTVNTFIGLVRTTRKQSGCINTRKVIFKLKIGGMQLANMKDALQNGVIILYLQVLIFMLLDKMRAHYLLYENIFI